uniref:SFRICE_013814 n=1 Tax=Spodoptera frugiperda TaxID=7108 RepID=A0A2H1WQG0_SPOFR
MVYSPGGKILMETHTSPRVERRCSTSCLARAYTGHANITCGTVSSTAGSQRHDGFPRSLKRYKYSENPPCPVNSWVVMLLVSIFLTVLYATAALGKNILAILFSLATESAGLRTVSRGCSPPDQIQTRASGASRSTRASKSHQTTTDGAQVAGCSAVAPTKQ